MDRKNKITSANHLQRRRAQQTSISGTNSNIVVGGGGAETLGTHASITTAGMQAQAMTIEARPMTTGAMGNQARLKGALGLG